MRRSMIVLALSVHVTSAHAQTRPSTLNRPRSESRQLVLARGPLSWAPAPIRTIGSFGMAASAPLPSTFSRHTFRV